ncbi:MAG: A/G-specific adenine glycosylase [Bacteroidales bacterium]|nr:A/G-specific adenine glycosylase [Bacteroidales bacterium]
MGIQSNIIQWYNQNRRSLPWRETRDPYKIWISEVILQQTRIAQGLDYYLRFISLFPTVNHLANAGADEVLKAWQGLGYYSRARNLHSAAGVIANRLNGVFPSSYEQLISLKGIGDYTASAVLSIAFSQRYPVVDGNIIRLISRITGITGDPGTAESLRSIKQTMYGLMEGYEPGLFNQAMMEFGALRCLPKNPGCDACEVKNHCFAFRKGMVNHIPAKKSKKEKRTRYFSYIVICFMKEKRSHVWISKRGNRDIWADLYEFPCIESAGFYTPVHLKNEIDRRFPCLDGRFTLTGPVKEYTHILTHQEIRAGFYNLLLTPEGSEMAGLTESLRSGGAFPVPVTRSGIEKFPVHRLVEKFLNENFNGVDFF